MPAKGVQFLPVRYPSGAPSWFTSFMDSFIKDVLVNLDVRNATPGSGIEITGTPDSPATISSSEDIQQLKDENYVLAEASAFLANARVIEGENGVVSVTDDGPGGALTISLVAGGIPYSKLGDLDELSVLGNPTDSFGPVTRISGSAQHDVLSVQLDGSDLVVQFGTITHESVSDFDEAAQDAVGTILVDGETVNFTYSDGTPSITAEVTIPPLTAESSPNGATDYVMIYSDSAAANRKVLLDDLPGGSAGPFDEALQSSAMSITSTTTYANTSMVLSSIQPGTYSIETYLAMASQSSPGIKTRLNFTGTASDISLNHNWIITSTTAGARLDTAFGSDLTYTNTGSNASVTIGTFTVSVAGTLSWQAAQNSSSGTAVSVKKGSWLRIRKLA